MFPITVINISIEPNSMFLFGLVVSPYIIVIPIRASNMILIIFISVISSPFYFLETWGAKPCFF